MRFAKFLIYLCAILLFTNCTNVKIKSTEPEKGFNLVSEEEEVKFGHYVDGCIKSDFMVLLPDENPKAYQKINEMGHSLVKVSDRNNLNYTFRILNTDMVNAFAGPGGYVYVTTGLLNFAKNKDEVAGVMAHEIAHEAAKHVVKKFRNVSYAQNITIAVTMIAAEHGAEGIGDLTQMTALFCLMGYSRDYERQADYLGVKYMINAGYDPNGMVSFLQRLWEEKEKGRKEEINIFFRSHPQTLERINDIANHIKELRGEE